MRALHLTFDDGPDPEWTPRVLEALERAGAGATFFLMGPKAQAHPELVERIRAQGHTVGLHCDEHIRHTERDGDWVAADADRALERLAGLGVHPRLWRTPYGVEAPFTRSLAAERGLRIVGWDADTEDWTGHPPGAMLERVAEALHDGGVVLAHDGIGPGATRPDCAHTVEFVDLAVAQARANGVEPAPLSRRNALAEIAAGAGDRERPAVPPFPHDAFDLLRAEGLLAGNAVAGTARPPAAAELGLVRAVAAADASVGRIFDGHLNAVERLAVQAPEALRDSELEAVRSGRLLCGVWGADPGPGEGSPARVTESGAGHVITGAKTFCSGAGGLERALVLARHDAEGPPVAAWVDLTARETVEIDETWYRSAGLRASVSHRVVFHSTPVRALFGGPGSLTEQPWFSRDALRTAASWAGIADAAADAALAELGARPNRGDLEALAAGRIETERSTIGVWLDHAGQAMDRDENLPDTAVHARAAIAAAARRLLDEAARACGSRPFATGAALDRARRDLDLFLLQHRLDPLVTRAGHELLGGRP
jgi:hypothetical protein